MGKNRFPIGYRMNRSKYGAKKTMVDGIVFDSRKESRRYAELKLLQKAGEISNLELQKKFLLIPSQKLGGKVVERECSYVADFVYTDTKTGNIVVEDTKGIKTKDYIIKRKLMLYVHGIKISEI